MKTMDISTTIYNVKIDSPFVVASSGLTATVDRIKNLESYGASAIILKSIFEEEILLDYSEIYKSGEMGETEEFFDYYDYEIRHNRINSYIQLISEAKKAVKIPVIASINCTSAKEWISFAKTIESADADAIELNLFMLPDDINQTAEYYSERFYKIVSSVKSTVSIPVGVKIGHYFTNMGATIQKMAELSDGVTLFNRYTVPDIDIKTENTIMGSILSGENEYHESLRWIGLMSHKCNNALVASTGIHDTETAIKLLLSGASAVQIASAIYQHGPEFLSKAKNELIKWMNEHNHESLQTVKGKLASNRATSNVFERTQFLRNFHSFNNGEAR